MTDCWLPDGADSRKRIDYLLATNRCTQNFFFFFGGGGGVDGTDPDALHNLCLIFKNVL